jgi:hypothetical protein
MWMKVLATLAGAGLLVLPVAGGAGTAFAATGGESASTTLSAPPANVTAKAAGADAVQALGGGTVEDVRSGVSNAQAVYQVQILDQGLTWTVDVDMNGNVLSEVVDTAAATSGAGSANGSVTANTQPSAAAPTDGSLDGTATESSSQETEAEGATQQPEQSDTQQSSTMQISGGASVQVGGSSDQSTQSTDN